MYARPCHLKWALESSYSFDFSLLWTFIVIVENCAIVTHLNINITVRALLFTLLIWKLYVSWANIIELLKCPGANTFMRHHTSGIIMIKFSTYYMSDVVSRLTDTTYFQIEYCACYCSRIVATNLPFGQNYVTQSWGACGKSGIGFKFADHYKLRTWRSTRQHALHRYTNRAKIQIITLTVLLMRTCYTPRMSSDLTRGNLSGSRQYSSVMSGMIGHYPLFL